jgi:hypothetical protein
VVFFFGLVSLRKETGLSSSRETVSLLFRHKIILERDGRLLWLLVRLSRTGFEGFRPIVTKLQSHPFENVPLLE